MGSSTESVQTLLSETQDTTILTNRLQELATQSRESLETRQQLGKNVSTLLQLLEKHVEANEDLLNATLRCIGNACVENPEACETVVTSEFDFNHFARILDERGTELQSLVVKVLYNICLQSEEARKKCCEAFVHGSIISALHGQAKSMVDDDDDEEPFGGLSLPIDLLFWITANHQKDYVLPQTVSSHEGTLEQMLRQLLDLPVLLAAHLDIDDFATLLEVVLVFLREQRYQTQVAEERLTATIWNILDLNESKLREMEGESAEDQKLLIALSTSLTWILSDVAANATFVEKEDDASSFVRGLVSVLKSDAEGSTDGSTVRLMNAACQVVGNFVQSKGPDTAASLVRTDRVHERVLATMVAADNADFLHSAAGLLIQLSRPSPDIREEIASNSNAIPAVERLGRHTVQELNQDALKLMRALGKDTRSVQERFKQLAGEVMATVAETQKAAAGAEPTQPQLTGMS